MECARVRLRHKVAPLQSAEHVCQADQDVKAQSTGHIAGLHTDDSAVLGQLCPPLVGCAWMAREWTKAPPPHEVEHAPQLPHAPITQSDGQAIAPHSPTSTVTGQLSPVPTLTVVMLRLRDVDAGPPQLTLHGNQLAQSVTTQSTANVGARVGVGVGLHSRGS